MSNETTTFGGSQIVVLLSRLYIVNTVSIMRKVSIYDGHLELSTNLCSEKNLTLCVFFLSKNEWFASADDLASTDLAGSALKLDCNLLGCLCLLAEDWLGLATETLLLGVISSLALSGSGVFAFFVLRDLVQLVLLALITVCCLLFRNVHLRDKVSQSRRERVESSHENLPFELLINKY